MNGVTTPRLARPRCAADAYVERLLPFGLVFSPPVGIALALTLTVLRRSWLSRVRQDPYVLGTGAGLAVLGTVSGVFSPSPLAAVNGLLAIGALLWLWAVGRFAVQDGVAFTVRVQRATALVAVLALAAVFGHAQVRVFFGLPGLALTVLGPENKGTVLGLGGNGLGPLLVFGAVLGLARAASPGRRWDRLEGLAVAALNLFAALSMGVRNALWGSTVGAVALVPLAGSWVGCVVLGVGLAAAGLQPQVRLRLLELVNWKSEAPRWGVWEASWRMIQDHPWLGVGPGQFHLVHPAYALPQSSHLTDPHNMYLKVAAEWGVPAAVLFLAWIARELAVAWKLRAQGYRWALAAGVLAFLAMGVFDTPLFTLHISGPVLVGLGVAGGAGHHRGSP
jgi:O-antigen ligase